MLPPDKEAKEANGASGARPKGNKGKHRQPTYKDMLAGVGVGGADEGHSTTGSGVEQKAEVLKVRGLGGGEFEKVAKI